MRSMRVDDSALLHSRSAGGPCWTMLWRTKAVTAESITSLVTPPWDSRAFSFSLA